MTSEPIQSSSKRSPAILVVATLLAACSIAYELLLAQTLSTLAANTVRWYSLAVGVFLVSMGFGAFLYARVPHRVNRLRLLFWVEIALILAGATVVEGVHFGHMLFGYLSVRGFYPSAVLVFLIIPLILSTIIGILTGVELPILMDYAKENGTDDHANEVLGCDYFGSLIGSLSFPLILLTYFQLFEIGLVVATVNLAVAIFLFYRYLSKGVLGWILQTSALVVVSGLLFQGFLASTDIQEYFLKKYYYYLSATESLESLFRPMPELPNIYSVQSPYQRIDVVHDTIGSPDDDVIRLFSSKLDNHPNRLINRILFLNGDFQTNTLHEEVYHEWFAHVPIIMRKKVPQRILVLGGGDGYLIRELVKYEQVREIVHIDLDATLVNVAQSQPAILESNEGAFSNPKVTTRYEDGFQFVRTSRERFEAIYIDFPLPTDYNLSKLYSVEFYTFVKRMLTDDGYAVFDASGIGLVTPPDAQHRQYITEGNDWPVYYNTIKAADFPVIIPYLTTLGFYDPDLIRRAMPRYDFAPTPTDDIPGLASDVRVSLRRMSLIKKLAEYVWNFQQGFIIMAKDPERFTRKYWAPPIPLLVLNRLRFNESFLAEFPTQDEVDVDKVNSIMLPRFPTTSFWDPRLPW